jgi:hypothetical protein
MSGLIIVKGNRFEFPSEPPVATPDCAERRGAGKGARERGAANPCRRAPFGYPHTTRRAAQRKLVSVGEL